MKHNYSTFLISSIFLFSSATLLPAKIHRNLLMPDWVYSIAFSPDGTTIAAGLRNGVIELWNMQDSRKEATLKGHKGIVTGLSYATINNLDWLASSSRDGHIHIRIFEPGIDNPSKERIQPLRKKAHKGPVNDVIFAQGALGTLRLISCGYDKEVHIWNILDKDVRRATKPLLQHSYYIMGLSSYSTKGGPSDIASASYDGTAGFWSPTQGITTKLDHGAWVHAVELINQELITAGGLGYDIGHVEKNFYGLQAAKKKGTVNSYGAHIKGWDTKSKTVKREFMISPQKQYAHDSGIFALAVSPDSTTLASGDRRGVIKLWDVATGQLKETLQNPNPTTKELTINDPDAWVYSLKFSPDGNYLAAGGFNKRVTVWSLT